MWTRSDLKTKAKAAFNPNYWHSVVIGIIVAILSSSSGSSSGRDARGKINDAGGISNFDGKVFAAIVVAILVSIALIVIFNIIIGNTLLVGGHRFFVNNELAVQSGAESFPKIKDILWGFKDGKYKNIAISMFIMKLFIALWTLLLVIPGIIKSYEYRMVPYLLGNDPEMDYKTALEMSKNMMNGQKWDAFVLDLSFIGWFCSPFQDHFLIGMEPFCTHSF